MDHSFLNELLEFEEEGAALALEYYLAQNNWTGAQSILDNIVTHSNESQEWRNWKQFEISVLSSDRSLDDLTSLEWTQINQEYMDSELGDEARAKRECLMEASGYSSKTLMPRLVYSNTNHSFEYSTVEKEVQAELYPNPARGYCEIDYPLSDDSEGRIVLLDLSGKVVLSKRMNKNTEKHLLELTEIAAGSYLLEIEINERIVWKEKLVKL